MGWLVKNVFAFQTLFFCGDFSSTRVGLCMRGRGGGWGSVGVLKGQARVCFQQPREENREMPNDFGHG